MAQPNRKPSRNKRSISRHPLFPAIAALWFSALFGLGSFALRATLLESLVLAGHIDRLIPGAAPPLGLKARLLLALLLGLVGAIAGWALARHMGRKPRPAPQVLKVADVDLDEPLPWPDAAAKVAMPAQPLDEDAGPVFERADPAPEAEAAEADDPIVPEPEPAIPEVRAPTAAERIAGAALDSLSHVELIERLAIGLQRRQQRLEAVSAAEVPQPADAVVRLRRLGERNGARIGPPPAASKPVPQETEKALRDALATLQRMSGSG